MTREELLNQIDQKKTFLCVGLDTDIHRIPAHLRSKPDPVFEFNKAIIDATLDYCVAYKPNLAFYESLGPSGMDSLMKTVDYIPKTHFKIADAKRGDIGNTAEMYAKTYFETFGFDAVTVNPYMGMDTISPYLGYKGKWTIVLGLTSNPGSSDFQLKTIKESNKYLFQEVLEKVKDLGSKESVMVVAGGTQPAYMTMVREILPDYFLLVPGYGAQGGNLGEISRGSLSRKGPLLVNSSRAIIYASSGEDFSVKAREAARSVQKEMKDLLGNL